VAAQTAIAIGNNSGGDIALFRGKTFEGDDYVVRLTPGLFAGVSLY
jgi:hypothetical protein